MKSISNGTIIVSLFLSVIISFGVGYAYFLSGQKIVAPIAKQMTSTNATTRLTAISSISIDNIDTYQNLLFQRLTDPHHYIKARSAEKCYRLGLSKDIPPLILAKCLGNLEEETELTKRWIIANVIAINYESGFEAFARELNTIKSPFGRMFVVQILAIHARDDDNAQAFINNMCKKQGATRAIGKMVRRMLKTDRLQWFKRFFPPSLVIIDPPTPAGS